MQAGAGAAGVHSTRVEYIVRTWGGRPRSGAGASVGRRCGGQIIPLASADVGYKCKMSRCREKAVAAAIVSDGGNSRPQ